MKPGVVCLPFLLSVVVLILIIPAARGFLGVYKDYVKGVMVDPLNFGDSIINNALNRWNASYIIIEFSDNLSNAINNMKLAVNSSLGLELYIPPPDLNKDAATQIEHIIKIIQDNGLRVLRFWVSISGPNWFPNQSDNIEFIRQMAYKTSQHSIQFNFATSLEDWKTITGNTPDFSYMSLLWYKGNNFTDMDDFVAFGGWAVPAVKQLTWAPGSESGVVLLKTTFFDDDNGPVTANAYE